MQVTNSRVRNGTCTTYTLEAEIENKRIVARHTVDDNAYAALNVKDASDLIESQLWQQLMHHIVQRILSNAPPVVGDTRKDI